MKRLRTAKRQGIFVLYYYYILLGNPLHCPMSTTDEGQTDAGLKCFSYIPRRYVLCQRPSGHTSFISHQVVCTLDIFSLFSILYYLHTRNNLSFLRLIISLFVFLFIRNIFKNLLRAHLTVRYIRPKLLFTSIS